MNKKDTLNKERMLISNLLQNNDLLSNLKIKSEYFLADEHKAFIDFIVTENEVDLKAVQHASVYNEIFLSIDEIGYLYNTDLTSRAFFNQEQFEILQEYKRRETMRLNTDYANGLISLDNLADEIQEVRALTVTTKNENEHLIELLDEVSTGKAPEVIKTGFSVIDDKIDGFEFGQFNIVAARPSVGKTAVALQMMFNMAVAGHDVTMISLETTKKNLAKRMISMIEGIELRKMKDFRNLNNDEVTRFYDGVDKIVKSGLKVIYNPTAKPSDVRMEAIQKSDKNKIIFIDFAQLMHSDEKDFNRTAELERISRDLKRITTELNVTIVLIAQIKRGPEAQGDKRPALSDIKGSGGFEQDANVAMLLYREDYYDESVKEDNGKSELELNIAKNKDGETGTVHLDYYKNIQKFYSSR